MSNPLDEMQPAKKTPWTILSDKSSAQSAQPSAQKPIMPKIGGKNLKVLPYLFAVLTFAMIFLFSQQFKNLSADLFNSSGSGDTVRFGLPLKTNSSTWAQTQTGALESTGALVSSGAEVLTGTVVVSEDDSVITTAQTIEVTPLEDPADVAENSALPENQHISESVEVAPIVETASVNPIQSITVESPFRVNTHTYDQVGQVAVTENLQVLQLENLHNAAPANQKVVSGGKTQASTIPIATENVQSWPEEVVVFLVSLVLSGLVWFGMRKIRA